MPTLNRVDQISIAVQDIESAMKFYGRIFEVTSWKVLTPDYGERTFRGRDGNFRVKVALAQLDNIELELVQTLEGETANAEFLQAHGDGLHHVAVFVANIKQKTRELEKIGFIVIQSGKRPGAEFAYMQNMTNSSIIIELLQRSEKTQPTALFERAFH